MEVMEFFLKGQLSSWIIQPIFNTPFQVALIKKIIKFKFIALTSIFDIRLIGNQKQLKIIYKEGNTVLVALRFFFEKKKI